MTEPVKIQKSDAQRYLESVSPLGGALTDEQSRHYQALLTAESPLITGAGDLADALEEMAAAFPVPTSTPSPK